MVLYAAYGASDDYAASIGIQTSFSFELPYGGQYGVDLPASELYEAITETWIGFRTMYAFAANHDWSDN